MEHRAIAFTARNTIELQRTQRPQALGPTEVRGRTLATLISPGTELAWAGGDSFPIYPGYAAIFSADEVGVEVQGIAPGTPLFCMGPHRSHQQMDIQHTLVVPPGVTLQQALLARLMGVSMTTLMTTTARPGDRVFICGAGPVGFLAAQMFALAGYEVSVVEPDAGRRRLMEAHGIARTHAEVPVADPDIAGTVALVVDCSGHEKSVLDACQIVRKRGEVVLIGVPWKRYTEIYAHDLLGHIFRNYVVLRSGWEFEIPLHSVGFKYEELFAGYNNSPHTVFSGFRKALDWLAAGKIGVEGLTSMVDPSDPAAVYRDLAARKIDGLFAVFDWQRLKA